MKPIQIELPTQYEAGPVNVYLFRDPEPVLIDTGVKSAESWQGLTAGLTKYGLQPRDLARVVITHAHVDHFGQAARLAELGVPVHTAVYVAPRLIHFSDYWQARTAYYRDIFLPQTGLPPQLYQFLLAYFDLIAGDYADVPETAVTTFTTDQTINLGGLPWHVLHLPGHCSHQTCFYQPDSRQFLASDMLLARTPTPVVEMPADGRTRDPALPTYLHSLDRVEALDIDIVYPGHGDPFTNHRHTIHQQRQRINRRKTECLHFIQQGYNTAAQLVEQLYADRPLQLRFAGLWMLLGYIDLLKAEGAISEHQKNGICYYESL